MKTTDNFISMEEAHAYYGIADDYMMTKPSFPEIKAVPKPAPKPAKKAIVYEEEPKLDIEALKKQEELIAELHRKNEVAEKQRQDLLRKKAEEARLEAEKNLKKTEQELILELELNVSNINNQNKPITVENFYLKFFGVNFSAFRFLHLNHRSRKINLDAQPQHIFELIEKENLSFSMEVLSTIRNLNKSSVENAMVMIHSLFKEVVMQTIRFGKAKSNSQLAQIYTYFKIFQHSYANKIQKNNFYKDAIAHQLIDKSFDEDTFNTVMEYTFKTLMILQFLDRTYQKGKTDTILRATHSYIQVVHDTIHNWDILSKHNFKISDSNKDFFFPTVVGNSKEYENKVESIIKLKNIIQGRNDELTEQVGLLNHLLEQQKADSAIEMEELREYLTEEINNTLHKEYQHKLHSKAKEIQEFTYSELKEKFKKDLIVAEAKLRKQITKEAKEQILKLIQETKDKHDARQYENFCKVDKVFENPTKEISHTFVPKLIAKQITIK